MMGLAMSMLLAALDRTIVATALPKIATDFNAFDQSTWVATAYMLTATACQPLYGKLSDIFGCKVTFLMAILIFEIGSALSGASQTMIMLIIARAISGVGGGGIQGMVYIIMSKVIPIRERGKYQSFISATVALSSVLGPLLGGVFTDEATWRWAFYINLPIGVIAIVIVVLFLHLPSTHGSFWEKVNRIDFIGTLLLLGFIITLLLPTQWGGNEYAWNSPIIIALFCVSGVLLIAFVVVEYKVAAEPIIPCRLFGMRSPLFSFIAMFFYGVVFFGVIYYIPLYYQIVLGESAISSGLQMLPMVLSVSILSITAGQLTSWTGIVIVWCWIGSAVMTVGVGLITMFDVDTSRAQQIVYLLILGAGAGGCPQTLILAGQAAVERKDVSIVTSLSNFSRSIGGVLGVSMFGAIFDNRLAAGLAKLNLNIPVKDATKGLQFLDSLSSSERASVVNVYVHVLQTIFTVTIFFAGATFLFSLGVKHTKIPKTK
ncbi:MFS general substrate transporter [Basidiobolus meristosporus CBS 931.73]|uniref:MFS general substrate transporter n=1 Tax=Basidiobolus meristosporus CBS 931.73 TaxID=1314790 RepID=A0A1Y1Y309_9FUNG|nr:MFS general substrate transporter [Basidiobolus meristosporus CBS 931.73]|eukprot:ORX92368.1 MFS general substrate transporter [Basidiobolus meristosporus CBS 931.73]